VSPRPILAGYRLIFTALIVVASVRTLVTPHAGGHHALVLATLEIAGALMLNWHRLQWVGAILLLGVFASAQVISAFGGTYPTQFLQYAASTLLIVLLDRALTSAEPGFGQH
jgi:hypothetical protein